MRKEINETLYELVCGTPPAWTAGLKDDDKSAYFLTEHAEDIRAFLSATTDSVRLVAASKASRALLARHDLAELEDLRATVQLTELMRRIPYGRQTDHSAHTLYLYLIGVALFLHNDTLRSAFATWLKCPDKSADLVVRFLLQWSFASILHDVGYIFQGTSIDRRAVDRLYRSSSINRVLGPKTSNELKQRVAATITDSQWQPRFEGIENPEDILDNLRHVPWFQKPYKDVFEIFAVEEQASGNLTANALEEYAYAVAASGYDARSDGTLDHAVAGGLFLFNYSSYWHWIATAMRYEGPFKVFKVGYPESDIIAACFAAAAHNVILAHSRSVEDLKLRLKDHPLLYLGVLCDELQKWDRFPAGQQFLADLDLFRQYCTDSEHLTMLQDSTTQRFQFSYMPEKLHNSVKDAIDERLEDANVILFTPCATPVADPPRPVAEEKDDEDDE